MREKYKYLLKNTGSLFISNFVSKILVFLLVPLYTSILSAKEYGIYDLLYTSIQILFPILSLNTIDAVVRFSIGETKDIQRRTFTIGVKYIVISISITIILSYLCGTFAPSDEYIPYLSMFVLLYVTYSINSLVHQFARGIDDIRGIAIAGVIGTLTMILFNIIFLVWARMGIQGYFYAMTLSIGIPSLFLVIRNRMWDYLDVDMLRSAVPAHEKEMLLYGWPLIFITLSWYINSISDRYIVTFMCGISANGIYSVSYKIPAILNAVQTVFIQAWQLSAIKEYLTVDGRIFYSKMYQGCQVVMTLLCSCLICSTRAFAKLLFANEFYNAWVYVPVLLLYIVFNTMSGIIGGVFSASKQSKALAVSAIIGAATNIILNFIFVYLWGPMGAAVATVISSIVIWRIRMHTVRKYIDLKIKLGRHLIQYLILMVQAILFIYIKDGAFCYIIQLSLISLLAFLSFFEVKDIIKR